MVSETLATLRAALSRKTRIAVVGDVMLDRYIHGRYGDPCPERPDMLRFEAQRTVDRPGGAANAAAGLAALGCGVFLLGRVGPDPASSALARVCRVAGVPDGGLFDADHDFSVTTVKTRYMVDGSMKFRVDSEEKVPLSHAGHHRIMDRLKREEPFDLVVVSDYAKGVVTDELLAGLRLAGYPLLVDPKRTRLREYGAVRVIKPNRQELAAAFIASADHVGGGCDDAQRLYWESRFVPHLAEHLVITDGAHGCVVAANGSPGARIRPKVRYQSALNYDPTGCGDSFTAALAAAMAAGLDILQAAGVGCAAGACAVGRPGTCAVTAEELLAELSAHAGYLEPERL